MKKKSSPKSGKSQAKTKDLPPRKVTGVAVKGGFKYDLKGNKEG